MSIRVESIILCNGIRLDPHGEPMDLLGIFNIVSGKKLPGVLPDTSTLHISLTGLRHQTPMALEFTFYPPDHPEPVPIARQPFVAPSERDPRLPTGILVNVGGVPLDRAGEYRFQVLHHDGTVLGEKRILVNVTEERTVSPTIDQRTPPS